MARKILLADDSVTAQNMGRKILADAGYEVLTVNNGSAALKKISEGKPDLIVLDVYMPGYSGLEVCQRLKEAGETSRIPVLLTVGKLEPFKPEEARRVRAEGFIVKPFEASELLSALTRLEDKIVPRAEGSKPGRFARAIAAVEEERRDPVVSGKGDASWKERIAFPSKKKESGGQEPDDNDAAIYNPVNKDLRTVVDHGASQAEPAPKDADRRVDLGALAHQGLPKDVTPQEIAALAAAAAQMKGTIPENAEKQASAEEPRGDSKEFQTPAVKSDGFSNERAEGEPLAETKNAYAASAALPPEMLVVPAPQAPSEETPHLPSAAEPVGRDSANTDSGNGSGPSPADDEPVTIAALTALDSSGTSSRWIAVPVALLPDDAAISLEQEFHKSFAAAAGVGASVPALAIPALATLEPGPGHSFAAILPAPEPASSTLPTELPEIAQTEIVQTMTVAASTAMDAIGDAVKHFETVAASLAESRPATEPEPVASSAPGNSYDSQTEPRNVAEAKADEDAARESVASALTANETSPVQGAVQLAVQLEDQAAGVLASPSTESPSSSFVGPEAPQAIPSPQSSADVPPLAAKESETDSSGTHSESKDAAAMAVAAGAEKTPEIAPTDPDADDPSEIASIVESVLADLRPKIVAEISRKLGKKK